MVAPLSLGHSIPLLSQEFKCFKWVLLHVQQTISFFYYLAVLYGEKEHPLLNFCLDHLCLLV